MTEEFVSYQQALRLKECGFDWECERFYTTFAKVPLSRLEPYSKWKDWNDTEKTEGKFSAPPTWMAQRWLREVKGIAINVIAHDGGEYHWSEVYLPNFKEQGYRWYDYREHPLVPTYELALSAGLDAILTLLTEKQ